MATTFKEIRKLQGERVRMQFDDGREVVAEGAVVTIDRAGLSRPLQDSQDAFVRNAPYVDFRGRSADEISPTSFRIEGTNRG